MKQFVFDESGLNDLLLVAFRLGVAKGVKICEPDLWKNADRFTEIEKAARDWIGPSYELKTEWLIGRVFAGEFPSIT